MQPVVGAVLGALGDLDGLVVGPVVAERGLVVHDRRPHDGAAALGLDRHIEQRKGGLAALWGRDGVVERARAWAEREGGRPGCPHQ